MTVRQNEDMRKISAWVAIIAVPTAVAGIYGMNFEHMPEARWRFGYGRAAADPRRASLYVRFGGRLALSEPVRDDARSR